MSGPTALNTEVSAELAEALDKFAETADTTDRPLYVKAALAVLKARRRALDLEAMCRAAGYSEAQIAAGTPYVEVMGD